MRLQGGSSLSEVEELKNFSNWMLGIGDGTIGIQKDDQIRIPIPEDLLVKKTGDFVADIVNALYPNFLDNMHDPTFFNDRAILAPTNDVVDKINDYMLSLMPADGRTYLSCDSPCQSDNDFGTQDSIHTPEFLNTIKASGLPNHEIHLKVGAPIMLLRNIDPTNGYCNGKRLIVTQLGSYILEARVINGRNAGEKVFIPRLDLTPSDKRIPFKFQRRQFPIAVSFAMTINKSQGQSLKNVGIFLQRPIFSHGQLYVAVSRVTSRKGLKILIENEDGEPDDEVVNIVYKEVFRNVN